MATIQSCDLVLAEVSSPLTGLGIEVGWANDAGVRLVCLYRSSADPPSSLHFVSDTFHSYGDATELVAAVTDILS